MARIQEGKKRELQVGQIPKNVLQPIANIERK